MQWGTGCVDAMPGISGSYDPGFAAGGAGQGLAAREGWVLYQTSSAYLVAVVAAPPRKWACFSDPISAQKLQGNQRQAPKHMR